MANPVSSREMLNPNTGDSLQAGRSLAQNIVQSNLNNRVAPTQLAAPAQNTNFGNASNAFGLMSSGFGTIGQTLEAPEQRRVAQANMDAKAAAQAEQTNYTRSKDQLDQAFRQTQADDVNARATLADQRAQQTHQLNLDKHNLGLAQDEGARTKQKALDQLTTNFLSPLAEGKAQNAALYNTITNDPEIQMSFGEDGKLTLAGTTDEAKQRAEFYTQDLQSTSLGGNTIGLSRDLDYLQAKLGSDDNAYNDITNTDKKAALKSYNDNVAASLGLNETQAARLTGQVDALRVAKDNNLQSLPADTQQQYKEMDRYNAELAQHGEQFDPTAAFSAKVDRLLGESTYGRSNIDAEITDAYDKASSNYEGEWDSAYGKLAFQRALEKQSVDKGWFQDSLKGIGNTKLQRDIKREMDKINLSKQGYADKLKLENDFIADEMALKMKAQFAAGNVTK